MMASEPAGWAASPHTRPSGSLCRCPLRRVRAKATDGTVIGHRRSSGPSRCPEGTPSRSPLFRVHPCSSHSPCHGHTGTRPKARLARWPRNPLAGQHLRILNKARGKNWMRFTARLSIGAHCWLGVRIVAQVENPIRAAVVPLARLARTIRPLYSKLVEYGSILAHRINPFSQSRRAYGTLLPQLASKDGHEHWRPLEARAWQPSSVCSSLSWPHRHSSQGSASTMASEPAGWAASPQPSWRGCGPG